jgi:hypothetical protein
MSGDRSDQTPPARVCTCPHCHGKFQVRAASLGKVLRCPHCRGVVSSGIAQRQSGPTNPSAGKQRPAAAQIDSDDSDGGLSYAARAPEAHRPYDEPEPDPVEDIEIRRKKPPAFVAPLWLGVYSFPLQLSGLRAWFLFGIGFTLVAFMGAAVKYVLDILQGSDISKAGLWQRVLTLYVGALVLFILWTGTFAAGFFLETIKGGAAGHREVEWPDDAIGEKFFTFLGLMFLYVLCAVPLGILCAPLQWYIGPVVIGWSLVPSTIFVFPVGLLCSLANNSRLNLWNNELVGNMLVHPIAMLTLYIMSVPLLGICIALGYLTIILYESFIFVAPITGFVWSACLLIYGRLLGRVAWIVTGAQEETLREEARRRKRLKRR